MSQLKDALKKAGYVQSSPKSDPMYDNCLGSDDKRAARSLIEGSWVTLSNGMRVYFAPKTRMRVPAGWSRE